MQVYGTNVENITNTRATRRLLHGQYVTVPRSKYYKSKKDERWVVYSNNIEATKISSDWFLWMHRTINKIPDGKEIKYDWQKKHMENQTGTRNSFKPVKIRKNSIKKKYETWK